MNRPHFRRRGRAWRSRPIDPEPQRDWLDGLDGLPGRMTAPCPVCGAPDHVGWAGTGSQPGRTRYDAEWPDVLAAEERRANPLYYIRWPSLVAALPTCHDALVAAEVGGDLAAMAAPLAGMARDDLGVYAEPDDMGEWTGPVPFVPSTFWARGRHRQTDPLDLILADLRDLDGQP